MKRLEIIVRDDHVNNVVKAIKKVGVGGVSVSRVQGQGAEEDPLVGQYYTRGCIMTVVDDEKVDPILVAVKKIACTNTKGDGKVFISNVEGIMDICTGESGHKVL